MATALNWLDEVIVLNESRDESVPGDVSVYRSVDEGCRAIENWWVENSEGFAFTATGVRLVLGVNAAGEVIVSRREECAEGPAIVLSWLQALAQNTLEARRRAAKKGKTILSRAEQVDALPKSVEGLLAYIGFPWLATRDWFAPGCLLLSALIAVVLVLVLAQLV